MGAGPACPERSLFLCLFIYLNYLLEFPTVLVARCKFFHRHRRRRRWPMTTIPTRLARAAAVSTSSVQQRKRVLDLYREWMRGVRFLSSFARPHLNPHAIPL